jgi:hypothetical protein
MHGSLCLKNGVLYVGRHAATAHVQPYDLDGHALEGGFSFRGENGRAAVTAIDVDDDHRLWIADGASGRVRVFNVFGQEQSAPPALSAFAARDRERLAGLVDVGAVGVEDDTRLLLALGGRRRHALWLVHLASGRAHSLRPEGDPQGRFDGLRRAAIRGRMLYACEAGAGRVQVFRDGEFHFLFRAPLSSRPSNAPAGGRFHPHAIAPLGDGRLVIAQGGAEASALVLVDPGGRHLHTLAEHGEAIGQVFEPTDVAIEEADSDHHTRVAVIDCDGDRVQVFTLDGVCFGAFPDLPRASR